MHGAYVLGSVAVVVGMTVVAAVYVVGTRTAVAPTALETSSSPPAEIGTFTNAAYVAEAPPSTGAPQTGTGLAGELAEFLGATLTSSGSVLGGVALAGHAAQFANTGVRTNTEAVLKEEGLAKDLQAFQKRQDGYDMVSGSIEARMLSGSSNALRGAPPLAQDLGRGVAMGLGDLANAPVEVAALLDSSISGQIGKFNAADTDLEKALVVLGAKHAIIAGVVFDGVGGGLADLIAKTPEERARAQEVLDMLNPSKQMDTLVGLVVPAVQASLAETRARLAREQAERDAAAKALAAKLAAEQKARDDAFAASLRETTERLAREKAAREAALAASLKQTADRLAREQQARDEAFAASLRQTADRLAREKTARDAAAREVSERLAREQRARDDKARADRARMAREQRARDDKAKADLQKIGSAFKKAFAPKRK